MKFIHFLLPVLFVVIATPASALSDVLLEDPTVLSSYELTLTYDDAKQTILPPVGSTTAYSIVRKEFTPLPSSFQSEFTGILVGPKDKEYQRFGIPRPETVATGKKTTYVIEAPYHPSGERIDIYKGAQKLFTIDVTGSRICVEDGMCRFETGESEQNCPSDCQNVPPPKTPVQNPVAVQVPTSPISASAPAPRGPASISVTEVSEGEAPSILYALAFFVLALMSFGLWVYMKRRADAR